MGVHRRALASSAAVLPQREEAPCPGQPLHLLLLVLLRLAAATEHDSTRATPPQGQAGPKGHAQAHQVQAAGTYNAHAHSQAGPCSPFILR